MTILAQTYLGNCVDDPGLAAQIRAAQNTAQNATQNATLNTAPPPSPCLEVYLDLEDNRKGRIHVQATSGESVGIVKERGWALHEGDVFQAETGEWVRVHLKDQRVLVIQMTGDISRHGVDLIHLGHALGNHHYPIVVQGNKLYVQIQENAEVVESTIRSFQIPGLTVSYEMRSLNPAIAVSTHTHSSSHAHSHSSTSHSTASHSTASSS